MKPPLFRRLAGPLALALLTVLAGCGRESVILSSESDDSQFRDGQQFEREGRLDEALVAYRKVIARRGDEAPESHLEAGVIYLNHIRDPIAAIYYFRRYLELEPNSRQAVYIRGMIDAAKRDFAATLPGHPLESQTERIGMLEQVGQLQRENAELRAELGALRTGALTEEPPTHQAAPEAGDGGKASGGGDSASAAAADEGGDVVQPAPPRAAARPSSGGITLSGYESRPAAPPAPPAHPAHMHTVAKGDTLFSIALRYYGSRSKWREILEANHDILQGEHTPLRIGMQLRIP